MSSYFKIFHQFLFILSAPHPRKREEIKIPSFFFIYRKSQISRTQNQRSRMWFLIKQRATISYWFIRLQERSYFSLFFFFPGLNAIFNTKWRRGGGKVHVQQRHTASMDNFMQDMLKSIFSYGLADTLKTFFFERILKLYSILL